MEKLSKKRGTILIQVVLISTVILILPMDIWRQKKVEQMEIQKIEQFFIKEKREFVTDFIIEQKEDITEKTKDDYIAVIEIPKIQLIKGLYDINDIRNSVEENIQILKESVFPDIKKGMMLLAGHSGIGKIAYFNHLSRLQTGDFIILYYHKVKYVYQLLNCYEIEKTGYLKIPNNYSKSSLILITCKFGTNQQLIFYSELLYQEPIQ